MAAAAQLFVGQHNFSNFANVSEDGARKNPVKTIARYQLLPLDQGVRWAGQGGVRVGSLQHRTACVSHGHMRGAQGNTACAAHACTGAVVALRADCVSQAGCCLLLPLAGWRWRATAFCTSRCAHACLDRQQGSRHP